MKRDLFVTDFWEFDFPYHKQFKPQVLDFVSSKKAQDHIFSIKNPSLDSYGGDELSFDEDTSLFSFFKVQITKLLKEIETAHEWESGEWIDIDPWLNINEKGNFNPPHVHPGNTYSGCYYLSFPKESGLIHFIDPRPQHRLVSPNINHKEGTNWYHTKNKYDSSIFTYDIQEGKVVIFPSWLMHYVDPNPLEDLRISIPFNAKYHQP